MSAHSDDAQPLGTPPAEVAVDAILVRALLEDQHPDLARLVLAAVASGWDNAMFRLGDTLAVGLPRRQLTAALIEREQTWLPRLASRLPLPVPSPLRIGRPGHGFPWSWSLVPWLPGEAADLAPPEPEEAERLAGFLRALHTNAPPGAPTNPFRGVPLQERRAVVDARLDRLRSTTSLVDEALLEAWQAALSAPIADQGCWVHGDLHARNVLVHAGRFSAVIDWGDLCRGDPATDLASVWSLFDDVEARRRVVRSYGPRPAGVWLRALGWAVSFGTVLLETGLADHPRHARMGGDILRRVAEGPAPLELI